jgi:Uma2 family endonuclease
MGEAGVFSEDDHVELLGGQIYAMSPIGSEHAACVDRLTKLFVLRTGEDAVVRVQNPVRLNEASEPEPDLALLSPRDDDYAARHPRPDDVLLVVEVADTSAAFDRDVKRPLYARAGVPELWIVDLASDRIEVHRSPQNDEYTETQSVERGQSTSVQALPALDPIAVLDVLGPDQ